MKLLLTAAAVLWACCVLAFAFPDNPLVHAGWFNVAVVALAVYASVKARPRNTPAVLTIASLLVLAFTVSTNGLLAPDTTVIVGSPGQTIRSPDLGGTLRFPTASSSGATSGPIVFDEGAAHYAVDPLRYTLAARLRLIPRNVVYVQAFDPRGGALTITQPSGTVFLSPVLMMQQRQTIAGLDVPFDSFAVPAARRLVKAVLFSAAQSAALHPAGGPVTGPSVLFAVDDQDDKPLRGGIVLDRAGERVRAPGVTLAAAVFPYPAVERTSIPNLAAVGVAFLLSAAAAVRFRTRSRS